jgi:hypothetical protein
MGFRPVASINQNLKGVSINSCPFYLQITDSNGKQMLLANLTKVEFDIVSMIVMSPNSRIRFTTRPYDYTTSFVLVDDLGNTVTYSYFSKKLGQFITKPKTIPIRINKGIWLKYRELNRSLGIRRTDCSVIRGFYNAFSDLQGKPPSQETMRYFIERVVKLGADSQVRLDDLGNIKDDLQKSVIQDKQINIYPVIRKEPSQLF